MKNELIKAIGLELCDIRKSKDLMILEVAEKTLVNKDTISKYENGNSSMKIYILAKLLDYYNITFDIFFKNVYDRMQKTQEIKEE